MSTAAGPGLRPNPHLRKVAVSAIALLACYVTDMLRSGMHTPQRTLEALANRHRLRIVDLLSEQERTAGELAAAFDVSRPAVSRHLRVLRKAGIVHSRTQAQHRVYLLNPEPIEELIEWASHVRSRWISRLGRLEAYLDRSAPNEGEAGT